MQKNNLCPISNKILTYEDTLSQSTFDPKRLPFGPSKTTTKQIKQKFVSNVSTKINPIYNNNINKNIPKKINQNNYIKKNNNKKSLYNIFEENIKLLKNKYKKSFELNIYIFNINCIINRYKVEKTINDNEYISKFYKYNDSIEIIPKKESYYYHHMIFLERPNFTNAYFNQKKKNMNLKKLAIYQTQRKKDKLEQIINNDIENEIESEKIFDTNVLETIENYSTTITQEPNNEKYAALTPLEIFKRCEDTKNRKPEHNDQKSAITFSESEISYKSKNIPDESMLSVVNDLSEKEDKVKKFKQEKKYTNYYIKKKDIQKFEKNNKNYINRNVNNKINSGNLNIFNNKRNGDDEGKEIINKKKISTSTNKKRKKINFDIIYQNTISKCTSKRASFINNATLNKLEENKKANFTSFGTSIHKKNKGVLNLKKAYNIKSHVTKFSDNYLMNDNSSLINNINNVNSTTNSNLASTSFNNNDKLLTYFFKPTNKNRINNTVKSQYEEFNFFNIKKRQMKKNTTLNLVNNNIINNSNSKSSQEKYKSIKKSSNFKSKSPLTRLFLQKNVYRSNSKKNNIYNNKKSVLICELEHNSQIAKSQNKYFFCKNKSAKKNMIGNKNISSNNIYNNISINNNHLNIMTLSQKIGTNRRNSYQFMKLKKLGAKSNLLK